MTRDVTPRFKADPSTSAPSPRRIHARSKKRDRFMREERVPLTASILAVDPYCNLGPIIATVDDRHRCHVQAIGLHERRKRSAGGSLTRVANLMGTCSPCNSWVEDNPDAAHRLGLVVRAGDSEWSALGQVAPS